MVLGFIKLFKSLSLSYKNNDLRVYIHLLINANNYNTHYDGVTITTGQLITSYHSIADKLKISDKAARVAVQHLVDGGYISCRGYRRKYTIITITDYAMQSSGTYNFTKLYRQIQANTWYADDVTAKTYYYILLHADSNNITTTTLSALCDTLGVTTTRIYTALDNLAADRAVHVDRNRQRIIITIAGAKTKSKATQSTTSTTPTTTATQSATYSPTYSPNYSPASPPPDLEDDWY